MTELKLKQSQGSAVKFESLTCRFASPTAQVLQEEEARKRYSGMPLVERFALFDLLGRLKESKPSSTVSNDAQCL
jgi:hypothetical protein